MTSKRNTVLIGALALAVFVIMLVLTCLAPRYTDDWTYVFIFGTDHDRIHSLWDVIKSQYAHYFLMNGRITAQGLTQAVDSLLGKGFFNVVNALVFLVFLYVIALNTTKDRRQDYKIISAAFFLVFLVMPGFYRGFLWMNGSFNYLWSATFLLIFHYLLENKQCPRWSYVPLCLYGFLCGLTNEAFVFGLAGAYFIYYVTHRRSLTAQKLFMLAGFYVGAMILVCSPGSIHRAVGEGHVHSLSHMFQSLVDLSNLRIFYLLLVSIPLLAIFKQLNLKKWLVKEQVLIIALLLSLAFIWLTMHASDHSRIGVEVFALLLLLRAVPWEKVNTHVCTAANVVTLVVAVMAIQASYKSYRCNEAEFAQIERHDYPILTNKAQYPEYLERFVVPYAFIGVGETYKAYGKQWEISKYYDNDSIFFLPQQFVEAAKENPGRFSTFQTDEKWPFYAIRETASNKAAGYALLELNSTDYASLGWPLRLFAPHLYNYSVQDVAVNIQRCTIGGNTYIIADKIPSLEFRLKQVSLCDSI